MSKKYAITERRVASGSFKIEDSCVEWSFENPMTGMQDSSLVVKIDHEYLYIDEIEAIVAELKKIEGKLGE